MEHYLRPDAEGEPAPAATPERTRNPLRRVARWMSTLMADREPSKQQSSNLIRNQDGTSTVIGTNPGR